MAYGDPEDCNIIEHVFQVYVESEFSICSKQDGFTCAWFAHPIWSDSHPLKL